MLFHPALLIFAATTMASPILPRAGGPSATPIPSNCSITNTLPSSSSTASTASNTTSVSGWMLASTFSTAHKLYEAYYDSPSARSQQCLEQCHGLLGCVSALFAKNVMTPDGYYGTTPHLSPMGCMLYDADAGPLDFVKAPGGQFVDEVGANICCPS